MELLSLGYGYYAQHIGSFGCRDWMLSKELGAIDAMVAAINWGEMESSIH